MEIYSQSAGGLFSTTQSDISRLGKKIKSKLGINIKLSSEDQCVNLIRKVILKEACDVHYNAYHILLD